MQSIAQWCHDRHRLVIAIWIGAIVGFGVVAGASGGAFKDNFSLPGASRRRPSTCSRASSRRQAGDSSQVVFKARQTGRSPTRRTRPDPGARRKGRHAPERRRRAGPVRRAGLDQPGRDDRLRDGRVRQAGQRARQGRRRARHRHREGRRRRRAAGRTSAVRRSRSPSSPSSPRPRPSASLVAIVVLLVVLGSFAAMTMPLIIAFAGIAVRDDDRRRRSRRSSTSRASPRRSR